MALSLSKLKWVWVILGVVIAYAIAYCGVICVAFGYATVLSFQVRGAPDTEQISAFAAANASASQSIFMLVGAFAGGLIAGRKGKPDTLLHGLAVGVITALVALVFSLFGGFNFLWSTIGLVLALVGGYLGGLFASRRSA